MSRHAELHLTAARLVVAFRRQCAEADRHGGRRTIVLMGAVIGVLEDRPFDVGSLARLTGLTRPTTSRLLSELERDGVITWERRGRRRIITPRMGVVDALLDNFSAMLLHHVSKMDQATFDSLSWPREDMR